MLLAEDNPVNQLVARRMLEKQGHTVQLANDGRQAVDACEASDFDVILMDVQMPLMDGFEASQAIRAREASRGASRRRVPIIALTAHALPEDRERCLAAGMDHFVSKPIQLGELLRAIEEICPKECRLIPSRVADPPDIRAVIA